MKFNSKVKLTKSRIDKLYPRFLFFTIAFFIAFISTSLDEISAQGLNNLNIFEGSYPRGAFFRNSEKSAREGLAYLQWQKDYSETMGIMGKTETEEWAINPNVLEYFNRFKSVFPDKAAIIHYNGNGRLPEYDTEPFFAGHWVHYEGTKIMEDISEKKGITTIAVKDASLFLMKGGRYSNKGDDITLTTLNADGTPNWNEVEEVALLSADYARNTITVRRGQYGTQPRAFSKGNAYAAAHVTEGPWGNKKLNFNMLWAYNFSTQCPRDLNGNNCSDILVEQLTSNFSKNGKWEILDGIQFDIMPSSLRLEMNENHTSAGHIADTNGDGKGDNGIFNEINEFGIGNFIFLSQLREGLGDDKLILADGQGASQQRSYGVLNGTEQEGFPNNQPRNFLRWSMGLNMFRFWADASVYPKLVYTAEKRIIPKESTLSEFPLSWHRLTEAAAVFENAAVFHNYSLERSDGIPTVWDEVVKGRESQLGWLGRPIGETVHLAESSHDELLKRGKALTPELFNHLDDMGIASFEIVEGQLKITASNTSSRSIKFRIKNAPFKDKHVYTAFEGKAEPLSNYPDGYNRLIKVSINGNKYPLIMDCFLNRNWVPYKYYFCNTYDPLTDKEYVHATTESVDIEVEVEGTDPFYLKNLVVHHAPEIVYREFENGLVLANLSETNYLFNLSEFILEKNFQRLEGSDNQDPLNNNGEDVGKEIVIPAKDAIFLIRKF